MPKEYISRDAVLADIEQTIENSGCVNHEGEIIDCVRYATAADVAPVAHGYWRPHRGKYVCSQCDTLSTFGIDGDLRSAYKPKRCNACDALMDAKEDAHAD